MKSIKTWKLFNEGVDYNLSTIKDMLLDFTDKDVNVNVKEGSWNLSLLSKPVEYIEIRIGRPQHRPFIVESCIFDVINYLKGCGLVLMEESWFWYGGWQHYQGCPNCLSDDFEDNWGLRASTRCNKCEYIGPPDRFLTSQWPVTQKRLELAISESKKIEQMVLIFSDRRSLYSIHSGVNESFTQNESFSQGEIDEIKDTVSDMLLELQFQDIRSQVWVIFDKMVQVELRKGVRDKSGAIFYGDRDENRSFEWSDVSGVVDSVSDYLSGWGFVPKWSEIPNFEVRANWDDDGTTLIGYDTCLYLKWKGGGL